MISFYKILPDGTLSTGMGISVPDGYLEDFSLLATKEDGSYYDFYLLEIDAITKKYEPDDTKIQSAFQDNFKLEREVKFDLVDKYQGFLIYNELTETQQLELAEYRVALKDSTLTWIHPDKPTWLI